MAELQKRLADSEQIVASYRTENNELLRKAQQMEDHSDKVDPTTIEAIELAISALKEELETEDAGKIKSGIQNVTEAAMKLGEAIYKASQEDGENADKEPGSADFDDNIVDADFEDLDNEKRS